MATKKAIEQGWGSTLKPPGRLPCAYIGQKRRAGDQLLNPLVDFEMVPGERLVGWGSTLKPPGRLREHAREYQRKLGINS